jgi:hypothetical protein
MKEALNFRTRSSAESEKLRLKYLGPVAALDVIGTYSTGSQPPLGCTGWPAGYGSPALVHVPIPVILRGLVTSSTVKDLRLSAKSSYPIHPITDVVPIGVPA